MARFERRAVVVLSCAVLAACNVIAGLGDFQDVPGEPAEAGALADTGPIAEDAAETGSEDSGQDANAPVDAGPDTSAPPDTGPFDAGPPPDATSSVDLRWPRWLMPNGAEAGLSNPASYAAFGDGGAVDLVTGLTWSAPVSAASIAAAGAACVYPWRVPTRIELVSILDTTRSSPPLVNPVFISFPAITLWTSSVTPDGRSWTVDFGGGAVTTTATGASVACVLIGDGGVP